MEKLLKTYFGYDTFRGKQKEIIQSVLDKRDTFVLMPTGGGKSLCYQLPALQMEGITLVVSPLIALMKDQVDSLKANGINAEFINSSQNYMQIREIKFKIHLKETKLLYVAPERFAQEDFIEFLKTIDIGLIAIDEAHCISEWGHDFRPDYRNLKQLRRYFPETPVVALTATATQKVREDIILELDLKNPNVFVSSFNRENLTLKILRKKESFQKILDLLKKYPKDPVIIYCFSRKETEKMAIDLNDKGYKALYYHAGLEDNIRKKNQELFIKDEVNIMVATIAFGMGIDKPNVRMVIHHTFPKTIEGYYQEIGRAGRDGLKSECILFYSIVDERKHNFFLNKMTDPEAKQKKKTKLKEIMKYAESQKCRRRHILEYFGEKFEEENCRSCDICLQEKGDFNITETTKDILKTIQLTKGFFGTTYIVNMIRGHKDTKEWHKKFYVFGKLQDHSKDELKEIIDKLIGKGLIKKSSSEYPTLSLTFEGNEFLSKPYEIKIQKIMEPQKTLEDLPYNEELFEKLRSLRKSIAQQRGVPPFIIFGDETLREMSRIKPKTMEELSNVKGVGEAKLDFFGNDFLNAINN